MTASALPLLGAAVDGLVDQFEQAFALEQRTQLRVWRLAVAAKEAAAPRDKDFVADQLALVMGVHPQSAQCLLASALQAAELPALLESWGADELSDRHVKAALEELHGCLDDEVV